MINSELVDLNYHKTRELTVLEIGEFLEMELPKSEMILSPWLPKAGLAMLHAYRGIGKTHLALSIAYSVASGSNLMGWCAPHALNVLYIDGEMRAKDLQERLLAIRKANNDLPLQGSIKIITPDLQKNGYMPDLAKPEDQALINRYITDEIDLVIVDNLSSLVRSGKENEGDDWNPVQVWALNLRANGKSVLFIHHSGKSGKQRGSSKREDVLDTVISLQRPYDYEASQGARFTVIYEKARGFYGENAKSFEAKLMGEDDKHYWVSSSPPDSTYDKVIALYNQGDLSNTEIADQLSINKATVSKYINYARQEGLMQSEP